MSAAGLTTTRGRGEGSRRTSGGRRSRVVGAYWNRCTGALCTTIKRPNAPDPNALVPIVKDRLGQCALAELEALAEASLQSPSAAAVRSLLLARGRSLRRVAG